MFQVQFIVLRCFLTASEELNNILIYLFGKQKFNSHFQSAI